jgi:hypothetical protein
MDTFYKFQIEKIQTVIGTNEEYFNYRSNEIVTKLISYEIELEKYNFLVAELKVEIGMREYLQESFDKKSLVDRLNSFSPGILAVDTIIQFIREKIFQECKSVLFDKIESNETSKMETEELTTAEVAMVFKYLQDGGNFIKRKPDQTEKPIQDLIGLITNKNYETVRKAYSKAENAKNGRLTEAQARNTINSLKKIKNIFKEIGDLDTFNLIGNRIQELEFKIS